MNHNKQTSACLVVGAGMAGLSAAVALARQGLDVRVIDKGRGVGGRMAYRRIGAACFDHGAQFITAKSDDFKADIPSWLREGVIREWSPGFPRSDGQPVPDAFPHYCGSSTMSDLPRHLAKDLDTKTLVSVTAVQRSDSCWKAITEEGDSHEGRSLLLTPPVPQSLALIDAGGVELPAKDRQGLDAIEYDPCFAVMAVLDGPSLLPACGGLRLPGEPLEWIADSRMKGISPEVHGVTLHSGPRFCRDHFDDSPEEVAAALLKAARPWIGVNVLDAQVHRWRYSKPTSLFPEPFLAVPGNAPLVFAGDAFNGPRVEGAALSGRAAAAYLIKTLSKPDHRSGSTT